MTVQYSVAVKNARLDAIEVAIGANAILKFRSGAKPTNITDPSSGTVLATLNLPADYMAAAAGGVKSKSGTWEDIAADAAGTIVHFEITAADGTTVHMRGTVTATGGGGDMTVDNTVVAAGQDVLVTSFGITSGN
jgi:hypothetical protein